MPNPSISIQSYACRGGEASVLIDVRSPAEFQSCHPEGAQNMPLDRLDPVGFMKGLNGSPGTRIYLTCQSGTRAKMAQDKFAKAGYPGTIVVEGGLSAWKAAGLPVVEGKKSMSIDRQARIVIGALVLLGAVIGWTIHPLGYALSAFVGAGLIFAGVTDTCAIAILISKMPWNRGSCSENVRSCSA